MQIVEIHRKMDHSGTNSDVKCQFSKSFDHLDRDLKSFIEAWETYMDVLLAIHAQKFTFLKQNIVLVLFCSSKTRIWICIVFKCWNTEGSFSFWYRGNIVRNRESQKSPEISNWSGTQAFNNFLLLQNIGIRKYLNFRFLFYFCG